MEIKKFKNHFLVAMPNLNDSIFKKSIILLCEHNDEGSMGLIINKPMQAEKKHSDFLNTFLKNQKDSKLYFGGPVSLNTCFILHDSSYKTKETITISNTLSLTSNKKIITDLQKGKGPNSFRFNIGYAGWSAGQLEEEIKNSDWILTPASSQFIFNVPDNKMWEKSANNLGLNIKDLCGQSGEA